MTRYAGIESLSAEHETDYFDCGSEAQTNWLRRHALHAQAAGSARVYVACLEGGRRVIGYYALAAGQVEYEDATTRIIKGLGRYPVPVVLLTRLGVDLSAQGRGLGSGLLRDAFLQTASIADRLGVRALLIHAETPKAAAFYQRIDPGFEPSPTDPLHLLLLIKDLRRAIRDAAVRS